MEPKKQRSERNWGVDLLRMVSMLMVVAIHILGQGGILDGVIPGTAAYATAYLLETVTLCCVNCYALISGYVGAEGHFRYERLFETHARVLFYTILITVGYFIFMPGVRGFGLVRNAFFPVMTEQYWYYTGYFGLMLFTPALQLAIRQMSHGVFRSLILALVLTMSVLPTVFVCDAFQIGRGYSIWWLVALYLVGAYIKKYGCYFMKNNWICALVLAGSIFFAWGMHLIEVLHEGVSLPDLIEHPSPAILAASVAFLVLFSRIRISGRAAKVIAILSPCSFSVYLIHAHPLIWVYLMRDRFSEFAHYPAAGLAAAVIGAALLIYLCGTLIDLLRERIFRLCRVRTLCRKLGDLVERCEADCDRKDTGKEE